MENKAIQSFSTVLLPLFMLCIEKHDILTFKFFSPNWFPSPVSVLPIPPSFQSLPI